MPNDNMINAEGLRKRDKLAEPTPLHEPAKTNRGTMNHVQPEDTMEKSIGTVCLGKTIEYDWCAAGHDIGNGRDDVLDLIVVEIFADSEHLDDVRRAFEHSGYVANVALDKLDLVA